MCSMVCTPAAASDVEHTVEQSSWCGRWCGAALADGVEEQMQYSCSSWCRAADTADAVLMQGAYPVAHALLTARATVRIGTAARAATRCSDAVHRHTGCGTYWWEYYYSC